MGSQGVSAGVGTWDKVTWLWSKVRRGKSIGFTGDTGSREGRLQQVFCCRSGDETWRFDLKKQER